MPSKLTTDKPPINNGQIIPESYPQNNQKARRRIELVTCQPVSLSCTSRYDVFNAFDTTWHPVLSSKLSKVHFSSSLIKLISSFLSNSKFKFMVGSKMSTPPDTQAEMPQGSVLSPNLYSLYINDTPQTPRVYQALFADDTRDRKEGYILRKLQRDLTSMESWYER
jgi:hypothetical protein